LSLKEESIITKEFSVKKTEHIKRILKYFRIEKGELLFVEDMTENAKSVRDLGVNVALADWGYSSERQKEEAKELGIPIIRNESIIEDMEKILSD
jgi:phosphoglycolate phosphatase-like HAD superfamily hydrolase